MLERMKTTAVQWAEHVQAWRASGRSAEDFAEGKPYTARMLKWWAGEFERRGRSSSASPAKKEVAMARVVRPGEMIAEPVEDVPLAIVVGQYRIAIGRGFDASLLRDVLRVLAEAR